MPPKRKREEEADTTATATTTTTTTTTTTANSDTSDSTNEASNRLIKKLKSPDYILSINAHKTASEYLKINNNNVEARKEEVTKFLSDNYEGLPFYRNALFYIGAYVAAKKDTLKFPNDATNADIKKIKNDNLEKKKKQIENKFIKKLKDLIVEKFDSDKMHAFHDVTDASGTNNFNENYLDNMINDEKIWRPFLLKLAGDPKYRNSKYMNHVVAKLSNKGYYKDVIKNAKTNDYFSAFGKVIHEILKEVPVANANYWEDILGPYVALLTREPYSILYANSILQRLSDETMLEKVQFSSNKKVSSLTPSSKSSTSYRFQRVYQEFRSWASKFEDGVDDIAEFQKKQGILRNMFIDNLTVSGNLSFNNIDDNDFLTNVRDILKQHDAVYLGRKVASNPSQFSSGSSSSSNNNDGDIPYPNFTNPDLVKSILAHLQSNPNKYIKVLQCPEMFDIFLTDIFHPYFECRNDSHRKTICEIIAIISSNNNNVDIIKKKLENASMLCNNPDNLIKSYQEQDLFIKLLEYSRNVPCVSMGVLKWVRIALTSQDYWTRVKKSSEEVKEMVDLVESIGKEEKVLAQEAVEIFQEGIRYQKVIEIEVKVVDHKKMQIFLEKVVDAMVYGDAIVIMKFLTELVTLNQGKVDVDVNQIQMLVNYIIAIASAPFSSSFSNACYKFFLKRAVKRGCLKIADKRMLKKFLNDCFKTFQPAGWNATQVSVGIERFKKVYSQIIQF